MKTACPQCGGEIEFRFDDSFLRVCGHCRAAVARTDRGVETLGKIADLMPMQSPLALFAEGSYAGQSFILVGKAQLRHAAGGMWQEWYAKFGSGVWGWLAEAQGRYYMTFEVPNQPVPPHYQLTPGGQLMLPTHAGQRTFTVSEVGVATYASADGELPYRLAPGSHFRYADFGDGQGGFATIDYGEPASRDPRVAGEAPPSIYTGGQIRLEDLHLHGGEQPPPGAGPTITSKRLSCPKCNGSIELRAPDAALRVVCPYCSSMLDIGGGTLSLLQEVKRAKPAIKLGSKGVLLEGEMTVIGYLLRAALVDGTWYAFEEYLLHAPALGFRWLVCSDGHWSYAQPVATGACKDNYSDVTYRGTAFKHFQTAPLRVDRVLGEFYWRVTIGEHTQGHDFVAPPAMLSREHGNGEVNWTLSRYMEVSEVRQIFGDGVIGTLEEPTEVAPHQVWPHRGVGKYFGVMVAGLLGLAILLAASTEERRVAAFHFNVPAGMGPVVPATATPTTPTEGGHVFFSEPFTLRGGENVELSFQASLDNSWLYYVADLIEEDGSGFITFDGNLSYYSGYDGEAWSEGSLSKVEMLSPVRAGTYVMRIEALQDSEIRHLLQIPLSVSIRQDVFQLTPLLLALGALTLLGLLLWFSHSRFEKRRWSNSDHAPADDDEDD